MLIGLGLLISPVYSAHKNNLLVVLMCALREPVTVLGTRQEMNAYYHSIPPPSNLPLLSTSQTFYSAPVMKS